MRKKVLSVALTAALALSMTPSAAFAATDIEGHWGQAVLEEWEGYGIIRGYDDGTVRPDATITRGEMATILDRIMGYQETAENEFSDLSEEDWCMDEMLRAVAAGAFHGDDAAEGELATIRPNDSISREEAALVVSRVLDLDTENVPDSGFLDDSAISDWAEPAVEAMAAAGYVNGYDDGMFRPQGQITRAEVVKIMDNVFADLYQAEGEYTGNVQGSAVIDSDGVVLKDMTISGDLIIAEGVADGHVELDNVTIEGRLIVRGGGENSVIIKGASKIGQIIVDRLGGAVRVAVQDAAEVADVVVSEAADGVRFEGKIGNLEVQGAASVVEVAGSVDNVEVSEAADEAKVTILEGAEAETVKSQAKSATIVVAGTVVTVAVSGEGNQLTVSGTVTSVDVAGNDATVKVEASATVEKVATSASGTKVEGEGSVESVVAGEGSSDVTVSTEDTKVENNGSGDVAIEGGAVAPGESDTTPGGSTSGGGGGVVVPPVTYYTVTFENLDGGIIATQSVASGGKATVPGDADGLPEIVEGNKLSWYNGSDPCDPSTVAVNGNLTFTAVVGSEDFVAGNGSEKYPYLIDTADQLYSMGWLKDSTLHFSLRQNIDMSDCSNQVSFGSFGKADIAYLYGTFDGNGHTITCRAESNPVGQNGILRSFAYHVENATIDDVNFIIDNGCVAYEARNTIFSSVNVSGEYLVDWNQAAYVIYALPDFSNPDMTNEADHVYSASLTFKDCIADVEITSAQAEVGYYNAVFVGYVYGNVSGDDNEVIGHAKSMLTFENCVNKGNLTSGRAAMFIGNIPSSTAEVVLTVTNCANEGTIWAVYQDKGYNFNNYAASCNSNPEIILNGQNVGIESQIECRNGGKFKNGPQDETLSLKLNEEGGFTITAASAEEVAYYKVSMSVYAKLLNDNLQIEGGTQKIVVSEKIDASKFSGDTCKTTMKNIPFVDEEWFENNESNGATKVTESDGDIVCTLGDHQYYYIGNEEAVHATLNGEPTNPQIVSVTAYDVEGNALCSAMLVK